MGQKPTLRMIFNIISEDDYICLHSDGQEIKGKVQTIMGSTNGHLRVNYLTKEVSLIKSGKIPEDLGDPDQPEAAGCSYLDIYLTTSNL